MKLRKILSLLVAMTMLLSCIGITAMAEETGVAKIGDTYYTTFDEALTATSAMSGNVTVEIYDKVTLNKSLTGSYDSITFVGKTDAAEIYLEVQGYITATGKDVAFEELTLSKSEGGFITNAGFMNVAFGIYDVKSVSYTDCTFANGAYASSGKNTFTGCTFYRSHDKYGLWAYGDVEVVVDDCTFADYRGIKMYAEGAAKTVELTVKNTDFSALTGKPAIVLTYGESVTLENNTYSSTGVFELDLAGAPNGTSVTSDVAPTCKNDNGACGVLVDGKIYTTVAQAAAVATEGNTVTLLHNSTETVEFAEGVNLDRNGFTAENVKVEGNTSTTAVAKVGDDYFTDIQEAIVAAAPAKTVEIVNDVVVDEWIMFSERLGIGSGQIITIDEINGLTIDGKGHSLTINGIESASNGNRLFYDATNLNVKDLKINYADGVVGGIGLTSGTISNVTFNGGVGILPGEGNITITGCKFNTSGSAIYNETDRDNLVVTGNYFETAAGQYAIYIRGNTTFSNNTVVSGKVNVTTSATGEISGNDFGSERFKVYNGATATISNNTINNLVFNDETTTAATFTNNTMSEEAQAALNAVSAPATPVATKAELDAAISSAKDGDTILLTSDIDYGMDHLEITKAITLDLGGKTLTTCARNYGLALKNGCSVTNGKLNHAGTVAAIKVWDAVEISNLEIDVTGTSSSGNNIGGIVIQENAEGVDVIKNVKIYSTAGQGIANGIETYNCGNATSPVIGSMENVTIDAVGTAMNISAPVGTATGCTFKGGVNGIELWIKGTYSASLDLVDCDVTGSVYAHDEFNSADITNSGTLSLTVDKTTTGVDDITLTINHADEIQVNGVLADEIENSKVKLNGTYYATFADAVAAIGSGAVKIELLADATLDITAWDSLAIGGDATETITINGNGKTLTFNKKNSDWNHITTKNDAKLILNDMKITDSGYNNGPWNRYDLVFACDVELNNVTSDKALAFKADATLNDVTINESGDNYAIWIQPNGQTVAIDGLTVTSAGRGIKIDNQYVDAPAKVTLTVEDATFTTAKKAAILVKTPAGADITLSNVDISGVVADSVNPVWNDEDTADYLSLITVTGGTITQEGAVVEVAQIGDVKYTSLQKAIDAAEDGDTVTLISDVEMTDSVVISSKALTLDLGEYTIYDKNTDVLTTADDIWGLIALENGAKLTICGNGTIECNYTVTENGWIGMAFAIDVDATSELIVDSGCITNGNGGIQTSGKVTVNNGTFVSHNGGTCIMAVGPSANVTVNDGIFKDSVGEDDVYTGSGAIWAGFGATININGGTYDFAADPEHEDIVWTLFPAQNAISGYGSNANMTVSGGTFVNFNPATDVVVNYSPSTGVTFGSVVAEDYAALPDLDGNYVVGEAPTATVNNLGMQTVPAGEYGVWDGSFTEGTTDMPLSFVMQFLADQTEADMETSPYADWYGDFVITFEGLENGSFVADGCYLAGFYGDFGWVKVPVDGMTIEDGARYPVMLGVGLGQKYDYICSGVQEFKCALYLTPEILAANPKLTVNLELAVVDNSKGEDAAAEALVKNENIYEVVDYDYEADDFVVKYVAEVNGVGYATLQAALDAAAAGTGNVTVEILEDIDLTNVDWNPVTVSAPGYPVVTVNGNNKIITGLNDMLFAGTWAGKSGLIINDLTIKDSNIVNDENDSKGNVGVGAFIGFPQASATISLNNCHLVNSTVSGGHWTGGLIGYAAGYAGNDGPVFMNLTITNCSVTGSTITGKGSVGGVIGHGSGNGWTNVVIENTDVSGNTITSTGSSINKAGAVMGTIGAAGQPTTANGETKTGGASISATVSGNTVKSNGTTITTVYGRQGTSTGMLYITGGNYDKYPIEENVSYAAPKDGYEIIQNGDGTWGVTEKEDVELFEFYQMNLNLESSMKVNFYISADYFEGTDYYAEIVHSSASGDITERVDFADWEDNNSYKQISYTGLVAKNMSDRMVITIYDGNGKQVSVAQEASIKTYAEAYLKQNAGKNDKWVTSFVDMLNYGAEAQRYFNYNVENLANADISDYQKYATKQDIELKNIAEAYGPVYQANLDLENRIVYNGYFMDVTSDMTATISYTDHLGNPVEHSAELVKNNIYHKVAVDTLVIADANQLVTITVYDGDGNVYAYIKDTVNSYLCRVIPNDSSGFEPLARAMAKFTSSAHTALHTK